MSKKRRLVDRNSLEDRTVVASAVQQFVKCCAECTLAVPSSDGRRHAMWGGTMPAVAGRVTPMSCAKGIGDCPLLKLWVDAHTFIDVATSVAGDISVVRDACGGYKDRPFADNNTEGLSAVTLGPQDQDVSVTVDNRRLTTAEMRAASDAVVAATSDGNEPAVAIIGGR